MVTSLGIIPWVNAATERWKDKLPARRKLRVSVFSYDGVRQEKQP